MSVTADTTRYTADAHYPTADGFVPGAVIAATGYWVDRIRRPVIGEGYGALPQLAGEAHGEVVIAGAGAATLAVAVAAVGTVDDDLELLMLLLVA